MVDQTIFSLLLFNFRQCKVKGTLDLHGEEQVSITAQALVLPVQRRQADRRPPTVAGHPPRHHAGFRRPAAGKSPTPAAGQTRAAGHPPTSASGEPKLLDIPPFPPLDRP